MESNSLDIADPYLSAMTVLMDKIPITNEKSVTVRNCIGGAYNVYHLYDEDGQIQFLVAIHSSCELSSLGSSENEFRGYVSTSLSGEVVIVDTPYRFDSSYCYYALEEDAYYDAETVLENIDVMSYSDEIKHQMRNMLKAKIKDNSNPQGRDFIEILGDLPVWSGFKKMGNKSTHWFEELSRTLHVAYKPACTIKGGVVSVAEKGILPCISYTNSINMVFAVCIGLNDTKNYSQC